MAQGIFEETTRGSQEVGTFNALGGGAFGGLFSGAEFGLKQLQERGLWVEPLIYTEWRCVTVTGLIKKMNGQ